MLARDEPGTSSIYLAQKSTGTEIAVLHPEIVGVHVMCQHFSGHRISSIFSACS
jgi:hypothetical protein